MATMAMFQMTAMWIVQRLVLSHCHLGKSLALCYDSIDQIDQEPLTYWETYISPGRHWTSGRTDFGIVWIPRPGNTTLLEDADKSETNNRNRDADQMHSLLSPLALLSAVPTSSLLLRRSSHLIRQQRPERSEFMQPCWSRTWSLTCLVSIS